MQYETDVQSIGNKEELELKFIITMLITPELDNIRRNLATFYLLIKSKQTYGEQF